MNGVELICACGGCEFRLNNFAHTYYWQIVDANPTNNWDQSYTESDPECDEDFSSDGYHWECIDCGERAPTQLEDALDSYVELHQMGPERAAKYLASQIMKEST
jgi:hypothetical protein